MTGADALVVAAGFGIDVRAAQACALSGGYSNQSFRVDAQCGRYVVKRYGRRDATRTTVAAEHAIAAHAAAAMDEVVAQLRDADGETIATAPDGGMAAIVPFIDGEPKRTDDDTACAAARVLARFHRAVCDVPVPYGRRTLRFLGILPWLRERFVGFESNALVRHQADWGAVIAGVKAATTRVAPLAATLPAVIVHGDPHPGNFVSAAPGAVRGLIDLDSMHGAERVHDLGAFVDAFSRTSFGAPLDLVRIAMLVRSYAGESALGAAERELLPEAMLRRAATQAWYVATRHGERVPGDIGSASVYAARVAEIHAAAEAIREAARG